MVWVQEWEIGGLAEGGGKIGGKWAGVIFGNCDFIVDCYFCKMVSFGGSLRACVFVSRWLALIALFCSQEQKFGGKSWK